MFQSKDNLTLEEKRVYVDRRVIERNYKEERKKEFAEKHSGKILLVGFILTGLAIYFLPVVVNKSIEGYTKSKQIDSKKEAEDLDKKIINKNSKEALESIEAFKEKIRSEKIQRGEQENANPRNKK